MWRKKKTVNYLINPKLDLTAYELYKILALQERSKQPWRTIEETTKDIESLPENVKRHFEIV